MVELTKASQIVDKLELLDIMCEREGVNAELIVIGGSGLHLLMELYKKEFRPTRDVDVQLLNASDMEEINRLLRELNIHVVSSGIAALPPLDEYDKKDAKYEIEEAFTNIKVYVPTPELLACTKIFTNRPRDLMDLKKSLLDICDLAVLRYHIDDFKNYTLNPNDPNLNLYEIEQILKEKGF